jgi:cell division inhibitor SepF
MGEGFFSKMKVLIGVEEVDEDETETVDNAKSKNELNRPIEPRNSFNQTKPENRIPAVQGGKNQFKLVVIEPRSFDECPKLVDNLKGKKPVIVNLEKIEADTARKIFDFLSGATYALDGNVQRVANNIFIFAPENVDVLANIDNKNMDFTDSGKNPWR